MHKQSLFKKFLLISLFIFLGLSLAAAIYFYLQYRAVKQSAKSTDKVTKQETEQMVARIGKLIELPENEKAQLAKVTDKNKLADQPFLKKAQNGDVILIFQKAKKAILYRPSTNKIIEVGFINIISPTPALFTGIKKLDVAVYNATDKTGYAVTVAREYEKIIPEINITTKANAELSSYEQSIIIDLNGNQSQLVNNLAKQFNLQVTDFPTGEATPEADILIIVAE